MKNLNKVFAVSALSLAVSTAYADGASSSDCSSMNDVNSFSFWENPVLLTTCVLGNEPPAAGPNENDRQVDSRELGRHDSDAYEPEVEDSDSSLHIEIPETEDGEFVGYYAGEYYADSESAPFDHESGGFTLDLENGYGDGYGDDGQWYWGYGDDVVEFERSDAEGDSVGTFSQSTADQDDCVGKCGIYVYTDGRDEQYTYNYAWAHNSEKGGVSAFGAYLFSNDGQPIVESLKDYWVGYFDIYPVSVEANDFSASFVAGALTPLSDVQALIRDNVSAIYSGNSHGTDQDVEIVFNFGAKTFNAEVGDINMYAKQDFGIDPNQDMSFTAEGRIVDQHFVSQSVSVDSGIMQGSFYGRDARIAGGVYDVTINGNRVNDVYTVVEGEGNRVDLDLH